MTEDIPASARAASESPTDGRSARRLRNREAVLDAVHDLFTERRTAPTLESVARRSGVSLRSIHRYFPDSAGMLLEALDRRVRRTDHLYRLEAVGQGSLDDRITAFVAHRLRIYEEASATIRVSLAVADTMPLVAEQVARRRQALAEQTHAHFATELRRRPEEADALVSCVEVMCQFEGVDRLLEQEDRGPAEVRRILETGLRSLLRPPA